MLYLVAIILPPLAVAMAGKPFQAIINIFLTLFAYFPGLIHALFVVHNRYADGRTEQLIKAQEKALKQQAAVMKDLTKQQRAAMQAQANLQAAQAAMWAQQNAPVVPTLQAPVQPGWGTPPAQPQSPQSQYFPVAAPLPDVTERKEFPVAAPAPVEPQ